MANRVFPPIKLDDVIVPSVHHTGNANQTAGNRSRNNNNNTAIQHGGISSLLSSIQTLHQSAIQNECAKALQVNTAPRVALVHSGAPPPPASTRPPVSFRTGRPMTSKTTKTASSTDEWFYMRPMPMTKELQMDLNALSNRNYLDPKRFYKSSSIDKKGVLQVGTVIEGSREFYSDRYTKKERAPTFLQEVMTDRKIHDYATNKYKTMQQQQTKKSQQQRHRSTTKSTIPKKKKSVFKKHSM